MEPKQLVNIFFEELTKGNVEKAFGLVDENVSWWIPGTLPFSGTRTKAQYMQVVEAIKKGFPGGFSLTVVSSIAEGNKVATEVESMGEHTSGKKYNNRYHFLIEVSHDKIISVKEYMDTLHLYQLLQP